MNPIGPSFNTLGTYTDKSILDQTRPQKDQKPLYAEGQKGDNVAHAKQNLGNFTADLESAVQVAENGQGQVAQFDGNLQTREVYIQSGDRVTALSLQEAKAMLKELKGEIQAGKLTLSDVNLNFNTVSRPGMTNVQGQINQAQQVLTASNQKTDDAWWQLMNGGSEHLQANTAPATTQVGPQHKPGEWYNGIEIVNGQPQVKVSNLSPNQAIPTNPPMKSMGDLQTFIRQNLDFNGTFTQISQLAQQTGKPGQDIFLEAMKSQIEKNPQDAAHMTALAKEIYAYATTGAGLNGQTDIGQMQAVLRAFAPEIHATASSNTPYAGPDFQIGGKTLKEGDGRLGRATMLEMRHIGANLQLQNIQETQLNLTIQEPEQFRAQLGPDDVFVFDRSGSGNAVFDFAASVIEGHIQSVTENPDYQIDRRNAFASDPTVVNAKNQKQNYNTDAILKEAFNYLGNDDFFKAFNIPKKDQKDYLIGDQLNLTVFKNAHGFKTSAGESALKSMAAMMLFSPQFSDQGIQDYAQQHGGHPPRLNTVADEPEQQPAFLLLAQAIAQKKAQNTGLSAPLPLRVMAVPTGHNWSNQASHVENINRTQFIDVGQMQATDMKRINANSSRIEWTQYQQVRPGE